MMSIEPTQAIWQCLWRHLVAKSKTNAVAPPGGQICKYCKWRYLVAKFLTNAVAKLRTYTSGATWWPNL